LGLEAGLESGACICWWCWCITDCIKLVLGPSSILTDGYWALLIWE